MKKIICILYLLASLLTARCQTLFTFEDGIPADWNITGGTLSSCSQQYKEGSASLAWQASGSSSISIPASFKVMSTNGTLLYIHSDQATNDTITLEFCSNGEVKRQANILCNFKGWREFNRAYTEYGQTAAARIDAVNLILKPNVKVTGERRYLLDNVEFNNTQNLTTKTIGPHMMLDREYLKGVTSYLDLYLFEKDIPVQTPTAEELAGLQLLRERMARTGNTPSINQVKAALSFVNSMNITENADGSLSGTPIDISYTSLTDTYIQNVFSQLAVLSKVTAQQETFRKAVRYILDQGIGEGCNYYMGSTMNFYTAGLNIPEQVIEVAYACEGDLRQQLLDFVQWFCQYNEVYRSEDTYKAYLVSDNVYLYLPHFTPIAAFQTDDAVAVRELKAVKRFIERNTEYTPGSNGILKPDGTGFHHYTHYNNYMYSYKPWTTSVWNMRGTVFRISEDAYERLKKAIVSIYTMATKGDLYTQHYFANAFAGRNPFGTGMSLAYDKTYFEQLIEAGTDIKGEEHELEAAYNYFFESDKYEVVPGDYEGFYAYNYSPAAIFRRDNWVASMRSITAKFWGAEIYAAQNRFGRYQSHGSLEVLYDGDLAVNGYPTNTGLGGWDWNIVPGTTTVHYTSWTEMMPNQTTTNRFDQYGKEKNFSGALALDKNGIFATDFDQIDKWGSTVCYVATNLTFKKTMFAFNDIIVSMATDIASSGDYGDDRITATNLFQNIRSESTGDLIVDGKAFEDGKQTLDATSSDHWVLTPAGTGYFIPQGNDPITIQAGEQTAPGQNGEDHAAPTVTLDAAKAWISHGVKPTGSSSLFVVVPAASQERMTELARKMQDEGGEVFKVEARSDKMHVLTYYPEVTTAYAFYDAVDNVDIGIVKSTTFRHLLMVQRDEQRNRYKVSICNPDLCPETDAVYRWHSTPTHTTLTVAGNWNLVEPVEGISTRIVTEGETQIEADMADGQPLCFELKDINDTSTGTTDTLADEIRMEKTRNGVRLLFSRPVTQAEVSVYSTSGALLFKKTVAKGATEYLVPGAAFKQGVNLIRITHEGKTSVLKFAF